MIKIAPSLLSADFACLAQDIERVEQAGADLLHVDVMDGHFVPNLTMGPPVVAAIHRVARLPLDVHLMVTKPETMVEAFAQAGAAILTVHVETVRHLDRLVHQIRTLGVSPAVSLNPATPLVMVEEILPEVDMVLLMSVNPGFGGQAFIPGSVDKVRRLKEMIRARGLRTKIEADGGINAATARQAAGAGADILVAGSAVYGAVDIAAAIRSIRGE